MTKDQKPESESSINSAESSDQAVQTESKRQRRSRRARKSMQLKKASSRALQAVDELDHVRDAIRAFGCISALLAPHRSTGGDSYLFEMSDLRSLLMTTNAEVSRRIATLRRTVETNHEILANATRPSMATPAPTGGA